MTEEVNTGTPPPEEHDVLMTDLEARAARQQAKIGELSLDTMDFNRGRRWPEFEGKGRLDLRLPDELSLETVEALAREIQDGPPLFSEFTKHNRMPATREDLDNYVSAASGRYRDKPELTWEQNRAARMRQTQNAADRTQRELFDDRNTATKRRYSIKTIRYLVSNNKPLDEEAAVFTANAIIDFGQSLKLIPELLRRLGDEDLAVKIIHIGEAAAQDHSVLANNQPLLRLVQIEQKKREEFWSKRLDVSMEQRDRLTKQNKKDGKDLEEELARLASLREE